MSIALHMLGFTVSVLTLAGGLYFIGIHLYSYADRILDALQPIDARGMEISR